MDNSPQRHTMAQLNLYLYYSSTSERVTVITLWLRYFNYKAVLPSWSGERDWSSIQWLGKLFTKMTQGYILFHYTLGQDLRVFIFSHLKIHGSSFPVRLNLMLCTKKHRLLVLAIYLLYIAVFIYEWQASSSFSWCNTLEDWIGNPVACILLQVSQSVAKLFIWPLKEVKLCI